MNGKVGDGRIGLDKRKTRGKRIGKRKEKSEQERDDQGLP